MDFKTRFIVTLRRYTAVLIDYIFFALWLGVVFLISPITNFLFSNSIVLAQLSGFILLVLPLGLYFFMMEKSKLQATIGKKILRLKVVDMQERRITIKQAFLRVLIRLLPWEIAHFGIWNIVFLNGEMNILSSTCLIVANVFLFIEIITPLLNKHGFMLHDMISKTKVVSA